MKKLMIEMLIIITFATLFSGWALQERHKRHNGKIVLAKRGKGKLNDISTINK